MSNNDWISILNLQPPDMNFRLHLIFPLDDHVPDEKIADALLKSLESLHKKNPILESWVKRSAEGSSIYSFCQPPESDGGNVAILHAAKLHHANVEVPSFEKLKIGSATLDLLADSDLTPQPRYAKGIGPHPTFDFRASRIKGGLILCFSIHHKVLDGTSTSTIIDKFAQESLKTSNSTPEAEEVILSRDGMAVPMLELPPPDNASATTIPPAPYRLLAEPSTASDPTDAVCKFFALSAAKIPALKRACTSPSTPFISTNDAVTALITHAVTRARRLSPAQTPTVGAHFPVNVRAQLAPALAASQLGNFVLCARAAVPASQALSAGADALGATAAAVRRAVAGLDARSVTRVLRWVAAQRDPADAVDWRYAYYGEPGIDYGVVSWANMRVYEAEFGVGARVRPAFVRVPGDVRFRGSCRVMPRFADGSQEIIMGLSQAEMEALEMDELWREWVEFVG